MLAGQLNFINPFDSAELGAVPANFSSSDGGEITFALVYSAVLSLCNEDRPEPVAFSDSLETDIEGGFPSTHNAGPLHFAVRSGNGGLRTLSSPTETTKEHFAGPSPRSASPELQLKPSDAPVQSSTSCGSLGHKTLSYGVLDKSLLSDWMDAHALVRSSHHCAMYCRLGMEAAGLNTSDRPRSGDAGDYGPFLLRHGAQTVSQAYYSPLVGDVVVFDKTSEHPNGHIEMYDGHHWVSDFMQRRFSPYRDSASSPSYTIYRLA
jgi:hypothetical protein